MEHFSLWEFCEGNLEGEILYWGPERSVEKGISLHTGPTEKPGRGLMHQEF